MVEELNEFFENFLAREPLFIDKKALQSDFAPKDIIHREDQIKQVANILAPSLRLERPSNLFIYGKTGTGKTVTIKHVTNKILDLASQKNLPIKVIYLNCKLQRIADTEYRLIAQIVREMGTAIPATGLPTDEVYKALYSLLEQEKQFMLLILDEIDQLVKKTGDEILYNLTRINSELKNSQLAIIGISNNLFFRDNLDPRVKSSLSEEEVLFPPYNALQIQDILRKRASVCFRENAIEPGVIEKCAAYAAREHGDARRALQLLRVAGELAERQSLSQVKICHIDEAEEKIEKDRIIDIVNTQPKQQQAALYSIISIYDSGKNTIFTGEVYELYKEICNKTSMLPLTQRRMSDILAELDMLGIINAKIISKGRYGRTREIGLVIPKSTKDKIKQVLEEGLQI